MLLLKKSAIMALNRSPGPFCTNEMVGIIRRTSGSEQCWKTVARPRGYKTFFMFNSAEHEIFSANKYENANNR